MKIDLACAAPDVIKAEVAIIGAGAAGITMARRFLAAGRRVALIESGGLDYEKATADMNAGLNVGEPYYELKESRLRFFGGTTAIWGGRCAELDPIDFEQRPWVPHSGWPFGLADLKPWYAEARIELGLPTLDVETRDVGGMRFGELAIRHWYFDRKFDRFGFAASRSLVDHPRLTLLLHATVREILLSQHRRQIVGLDVRAPNAGRLLVEANTYILAAGGLENPRILLASNSVAENGVGNDNDLVGRFFMEHPHARGGKVVGAGVWTLLKAFRRRRQAGVEYAPTLTASCDLQRREQLLNSAMTIAARPPVHGSVTMTKRLYLHARHKMEPTRAGRTLWKTYRRARRSLKQVIGPVRTWARVRRGTREMAIVLRGEQSPNPDSRLTLDRRTDSIGMPRIRLDWRLDGLDVRSASGLVDALDRELRRLNRGEVAKAEWLRDGATRWVVDPLVSAHPIGGYHHMGTTRMAVDPRRGVTDGWGRVHGIENLYIAGSSLFPTSGWANPTLTILALALRTCDKILHKAS